MDTMKQLVFAIALGALFSGIVGALSVQPELTEGHHVLIEACVEAWKFSAATVFSMCLTRGTNRR